MYRPSLSLLATMASLSLYSSSAFADRNQDILSKSLPKAEQSDADVRVTMGLGMLNTARYIGSNERRYRVLPTLSAVWKNGWFAGLPRGVGYNFSTDSSTSYGLGLTVDMGRKQNASSALAGLGDVSVRPELGAFYSYSASKEVRLDTSLRYGSGLDRKGMLFNIGASYKLTLAADRYATFGLASTYANSSYMQTYFGVDAAQSASSGYAIYTPGSGIREVDLTASYTYKIDKNWSVITGTTLGKLGNAVKAAPMSRSNNHNSIHFLTSYTF